MDHPKVGGVTSPAMWEVHLHQELAFCDIEYFVARTETSDGAFESYWCVRSKSDLKKIFLHMDYPKVKGGE